jgi:hypothetical protein
MVQLKNHLDFLEKYGAKFSSLLNVENIAEMAKEYETECIDLRTAFIKGFGFNYFNLAVMLYMLSKTTYFKNTPDFSNMDSNAKAVWVWNIYCNNFKVNAVLQKLFY